MRVTVAQPVQATASKLSAQPTLQRKCACGGTPGPTGECAECKRQRLSLQTKLAINQPGDQYEQEADRIAEEAVGGGRTGRPSISSLGSGGAVQCEEPVKPKTEEEKYKEAAKKVGEAFLETPPGKEITKKAEELGDAFISTLPGKIITGAAVTGAVAALAATHKELPIGIPEIPLDKIRPGLKMKITYEGPVDKPTRVVATFTITLGKEKARDKKTAPSESEKFRAETARMAADQAKFRESLKSDEEKASEQEMINAYVSSKMLAPGQLTPRTSPLSFGAVGQDPGFRPGAPAAGPRRSLGPWAPDFKLSGENERGTEEKRRRNPPAQGRGPSGSGQRAPDRRSGPAIVRRTARPRDARVHGRSFRLRVWKRADSSRRTRGGIGPRRPGPGLHGRAVVFAGGSFAPETNAGRELLAHELTHVLQQNAMPPAVQRAVPAGLEVTGRQNGTGSPGSHSVFFERNDAAIDLDGKLAILLAGGGMQSIDDLDLIGRVSEDEATTPTTGRALADRRINAVDAELKTTGHSGKRNPDPKPDVGDGRLDYRSLREVEIAPAGATSAVPDCKKTAATGPCSVTVETDFVATRTEAQGLVDKARRLLTSGTDASTNDLRDEFFGGGGGAGSGAAVVATLDANLGKIKSQMDVVAKPKRHRCGTLCDGTCTVAIAYNEDDGKKATLTLCPTFVSAGKQERKRNFIHETAHGTPGLGLAGKAVGTTDIAYRHERRISSLAPDQALQNSDSYSLFVMLVADPSFARPKRPVDKLTVAAGEKTGVADTLTLLADWLKWSTQETTSTYSTMAESRPPKKKWTNSYYEATMKLIAAQFGLTTPPALPTDDDRFAVAGLADRYKTMHKRVRANLEAKRDPAAKTTSWSAGPGTSIVLGDDFFALTTTPERTRLLLRALVGRVSNIIAGHQSKIVDLAEQLNARHPLP